MESSQNSAKVNTFRSDATAHVTTRKKERVAREISAFEREITFLKVRSPRFKKCVASFLKSFQMH